MSDAQNGEDDSVLFGYRRVPSDKKIHLVQRHFDTISRKYDLMNTLLSLGLHYLWKRAAVDMLGAKEGDRIVDLCGGTGDLAILAAKIVGRPGRVVLYDVNRAMMLAGIPKLLGSGLRDRVQYVQGDVEQVSLVTGHFDAAMVGFGIRNLTHMEKGLEEIFRLLKPEGKLMCLEFSMPTVAPLRWLYDIYSFHVMPLAGKLFVGSREAYTYLPESIRMFPGPRELTAMLEGIGFSRVTYRRLTQGIAAVHIGVKAG